MDIDRLLPTYNVSERHDTLIAAPPERVYEAVTGLDLGGSRVLRTLFALRGISLGRVGIPGLLDFGFIFVSDRPPAELVFGLIGRFWRLRGDLQRVAPEEFASWERDGYAKVAWNFHLIEERPGTTRLSTETRIQCFGATSRRHFGWYWRVVGRFSGWTRREMLRLIKAAAETEAARQEPTASRPGTGEG